MPDLVYNKFLHVDELPGQEGTVVNASVLNNIEEGIELVYGAVGNNNAEEIIEEMHGMSISQMIVYLQNRVLEEDTALTVSLTAEKITQDTVVIDEVKNVDIVIDGDYELIANSVIPISNIRIKCEGVTSGTIHDYLFTGELSSFKGGTVEVKEKLRINNDGSVIKEKKIDTFLVNSSASFTMVANQLGYKSFKSTVAVTALVPEGYSNDDFYAYSNGQRFNGTGGTSAESVILWHNDAGNDGKVTCTISDTVTGLAAGYTPSQAEIETYFDTNPFLFVVRTESDISIDSNKNIELVASEKNRFSVEYVGNKFPNVFVDLDPEVVYELTLINGWTGKIKMWFDKLGYAHFVARNMAGGGNATICANMPSVFKPKTSFSARGGNTYDSTHDGAVTLYSNGDVRMGYTPVSQLDFDVVYKVVI